MEFAPYMHESCHVVELHEVATSSTAVIDYLKHCWELENKSLYDILWNEARCYKQSEFIFIEIPVNFKHPDRYQDGQPIIKDKCMKLFHGTRETNVRNILHQGLQSSHLAHKVIGTWVNSCFAEAINWNYSILDLLPGVALSVNCNKQELRQNADIMQGSSKRFLQELQSGQVLPSLAITNIRAILPNVHRINIRNQFLQACTDTIHFLCHLDINQDFRNNIHKDSMQLSLYMLTSIRIAYGGSADIAYSLRYGYADQREHVAISNVSIWLANLMWLMQRQSDTRRKEGLNNFPFENIPRPLQFFFLLS